MSILSCSFLLEYIAYANRSVYQRLFIISVAFFSLIHISYIIVFYFAVCIKLYEKNYFITSHAIAALRSDFCG